MIFSISRSQIASKCSFQSHNLTSLYVQGPYSNNRYVWPHHVSGARTLFSPWRFPVALSFNYCTIQGFQFGVSLVRMVFQRCVLADLVFIHVVTKGRILWNALFRETDLNQWQRFYCIVFLSWQCFLSFSAFSMALRFYWSLAGINFLQRLPQL